MLPLQRARQSAQGPRWWSTAAAVESCAEALRSEHFAVLDGFLEEETCEALAAGALSARCEMVRGATGAAARAREADLAKVRWSSCLALGLMVDGQVLNQPSRALPATVPLSLESGGDVVKFCDEGEMPGVPGLLAALDALLQKLKRSSVAQRLRHVDWANSPMRLAIFASGPSRRFAIYPGGASRYIKHVDNTLGTDGRRLTAVLYLNRDWKKQDGGCLRLFEPCMSNVSVKRDVEPLWNRLVPRGVRAPRGNGLRCCSGPPPKCRTRC